MDETIPYILQCQGFASTRSQTPGAGPAWVRMRHESPPQHPKHILDLRWNPTLRLVQRFPTLKNRSGWKYSSISTWCMEEPGKEMGKSKSKVGEKRKQIWVQALGRRKQRLWKLGAGSSGRWSRLRRESCYGIWTCREIKDWQVGESKKKMRRVFQN